MGYTITEKLLMRASGKTSLKTGELIVADLDMVLGNDITSPVAIAQFEKKGLKKVFDREKIAIVLDHFTPNKDIKSAEQCATCRRFCKEYSIKHFFDVGTMGIEHALLPEKGIVKPGDVVIGADSHTCTYGALCAFSTGVGSTDMAMGMATGKCWFRVPAQIKVNLVGKPSPYVSGKDVILHLIGLIGVDGALYKSLEFAGEGIKYLSMDDRFTICNMAIECGAKNGVFPFDEITAEYVKTRAENYSAVSSDEDACYEREIEIDLSSLLPTVAFPHLPSNTRTLPLNEEVKVDQVFIGSCTNGRLSDIAAACKILDGKKVADGVRLIVVPATQKIYLDCVHNGYVDIVINAGGVFSTPTCGACLGGHMGILASKEVCVSTTNRNFVGRMGASDSLVYLASPAVAAATAVAGKLVSPQYLQEVCK